MAEVAFKHTYPFSTYGPNVQVNAADPIQAFIDSINAGEPIVSYKFLDSFGPLFYGPYSFDIQIMIHADDLFRNVTRCVLLDGSKHPYQHLHRSL